MLQFVHMYFILIDLRYGLSKRGLTRVGGGAAGVNIKNHVSYVAAASKQNFVDWSQFNTESSLHSNVKLHFISIGSTLNLVKGVPAPGGGGGGGKGVYGLSRYLTFTWDMPIESNFGSKILFKKHFSLYNVIST